MSTLALAGQILLPNGVFSKATVRIRDAEIASVDSGADPRADVVAPGWIVPGFIDLQVNGGFGYDITADPGSVLALSEKLPQTGVTAFLPTIISSPIDSYRPALKTLEQAARESRGAEILGVHLEGPYLSPCRAGAHNPEYLRQPSIAEFDAILASPLVHIVTLAPELAGALELIRHLRRQSIVVSAGHSEATYDQTCAGFEAGIGFGTHLFNAMSAWTPRAPGLAGALLSSDVPCGIIADGVHSQPASVDIACRAKGTQSLVLVTDAMAAMGMRPGDYVLGDRAVSVDATSARLSDGTLAGSILTMDAAVRNVMEFAGISLADAVAAASRNPAQVLGIKRGQIAPGALADLVVLDESRQVQMTLIKGNIVYQRG